MPHYARSTQVRTLRAARPKTMVAAAALASLVVIGAATPSLAFPSAVASTSTAVHPLQSLTTETAYRGYRNFNAPHHNGFRGRAFRGGHGWNYGGAAIGAGVVGLAAGALIGEAVASSAPIEEEVSYCANRFRSYDPSTGTYLGYDGLEHSCP